MDDLMDLYCGDCLEILPTLPDNSMDLIATDPPYFKFKDEAWDRQWDKPREFLAWLGRVLAEFQRVLKPNGSLYVFASPRMAARVEVLASERFNVLNRIRWIKEAGWHNKAKKEDLRSFLSPWEEIIFAEHYGADGYAKGEAGYGVKCDELRGFVFEPLRAYLDGERKRAGVKASQIQSYFESRGWPKYVIARHSFSQSQWELPTAENYERLRETFARLNGGGEYLRREYDDLRREYDDLRRPFSVSADVPYTDVWTFPTVQGYAGKHPCEKPAAMMEYIIRSSSREGATVLDAFMGSGSTGKAARKLGRKFIGIEKDPVWFEKARAGIGAVQLELV